MFPFRLQLIWGFVIAKQPTGHPSERPTETGTSFIEFCVWVPATAGLSSSSIPILMLRTSQWVDLNETSADRPSSSAKMWLVYKCFLCAVVSFLSRFVYLAQMSLWCWQCCIPVVKIKVSLKLFKDQNRLFRVVWHMNRSHSTFKSVLTAFSYSEEEVAFSCFFFFCLKQKT